MKAARIDRLCHLLLVGWLLFSLPAHGAAPFTYEAVARADDPAPNTNGSYKVFTSPVINNQGAIVFSSYVQPPTGGSLPYRIWKWTAASGAVPVAIAGQTAPGGGGTYSYFTSYNLNDSGFVAFTAALSGGGYGLFVDRGQGVEFVDYSSFYLFATTIFSSAGVAYATGDNSAIRKGWPGALVDVAKLGDTAPGTAGATFQLLGPPLMNNAGQVVFAASVTPGFSGADGVWTDRSGTLQRAFALPGSPTGMPAGYTINSGSHLQDGSAPALDINKTAQIAMGAPVYKSGGVTGASALFIESGGTLARVIGYPDDLPGEPGAQVYQVAIGGGNDNGFTLNASGQLAIAITLKTGPAPGSRFLLGPANALQAPLATDPQSYATAPFGTNQLGETLVSDWEYRDNGVYEQTLWLTDENGTPQLAAKTGDSLGSALGGNFDQALLIGNGQYMAGSGGDDGLPRCLNDQGDLALLALAPLNNVGSVSASSIVLIHPNVPTTPTGDLLIKESTESDSAFGANDVYQTSPSGAQLRQESFKPAIGAVVAFDVEFQNDKDEEASYVLTGSDSGDTGWTVEALFNGVDQWAALSSGGVSPGPLAAHASLRFSVRLRGTDATKALPSGMTHGFTIKAASANNPNTVQDAVGAEAKTVTALTVNTTGDEPNADPTNEVLDVDPDKPGQQVTLRAAIEYANAHPGRDIIEFNIPSDDPSIINGTPYIRPRSPLPDISETVTIDGFSQNSAATTPPIELSGDLIDPSHSGASGLTIEADRCFISGLTISRFPDCGILLSGNRNQVYGCFIGTDPTGHLPDPNGKPTAAGAPTLGFGILVSSGMENYIGGDLGGPSSNLIANFGSQGASTHYGPCIGVRKGADGTIISGNKIGTDLNGTQLSKSPGALLSYGIAVDSDANVIGGDSTASQNLIVESEIGIVLTGSDNLVLGNRIGVGASVVLPNRIGVLVAGRGNIVGRTTTPNEVSYNEIGLDVREAEDFHIQGNSIGVENPGESGLLVLRPSTGIRVSSATGALSNITSNVVAGQWYHGIEIGTPESAVNGVLVENNLLRRNGLQGESGSGLPGLAGIRIVNGVGNRLVGNLLESNFGLGIVLDGFRGSGRGANQLLSFPLLTSSVKDATGLQVGVTYRETLHGSSPYHFEFFSSKAGNQSAETYVNASDFTTDASGDATFVATLPAGRAPGSFITATATDIDGNTSQLSGSLLTQGPTHSDSDGMSDEVEQQVPNRPSQSLQASIFAPLAVVTATGDGDGDGIPDSQEANVASFPGTTGQWLTLAAPAGVTLENIVPSSPADLEGLPRGYVFPVGVVGFKATGFTSGQPVVIKEIFHDALAFSTVFAYGPTPDKPQPHWYEFLFDGKTGGQLGSDEIAVTLVDGKRGDHDLTPNGAITTFLAPAYLPATQAIALTGAQVTNEPANTRFASFSPPQSGPFAGTMLVGKTKVAALFAANGSVRARVGGEMPGMTGVVFAKLGQPSGDAAFATLARGGVTAKDDEMILAGVRDGPLRIVAREGQLTDLSGVSLKKFGTIDGNGAAVFFLATLQGSGITAKNNAALCSAPGDGTVRVLVQKGRQVDGLEVSVISTLVGVRGTLAEGRWRLSDYFAGARLTFADHTSAIYSFPALSDSQVPWTRWVGTGPGTASTDPNIVSLGFPGFGLSGPAFTARYKVGVAGVTADDDHVVLRVGTEGIDLLARKGDPAPGIAAPAGGPAATFKTMADPVSGIDGRTAFIGTVAGVKANVATALFYCPDRTSEILLARIGDPAPGGGKFAAFNSLALPDGSSSGPLFTATLAADHAAGISKNNNSGLWAADASGQLALILRAGQTVNVGGATRTVKSFSALAPAPGSIGAAHGYDGNGGVTVLATFTDRETALMELTLP